MIPIALGAVLATAAGILAEHRRGEGARTLSRRTLRLMLYGGVPFVAFVNLAHLRLTLAGGLGLGLGLVMLTLVAVAAWLIGRRWMGLERHRLGAVVCCTVITNTSYLGNAIVLALLGSHALHASVAWDQLVGGPALFILGFGAGASFGDGEETGLRPRVRRFVLGNPPLWAAVAGLLVPAGWVPTGLETVSRVLVDAMLVTGFFAAGIILSAERRREGVSLLAPPDRPVVLVLVMRLALAPLLLLGLAAPFVSLPTAYLVQSVMPTGLNSLVVGHAFGLDLRVISTAVIWGSAIVLLAALVLGFA